MNLKSFHLLFIAASAALALLFGAWCWRSAAAHDGVFRAAAAGSFAAAAGLVVYGGWFVAKMRRLR